MDGILVSDQGIMVCDSCSGGSQGPIVGTISAGTIVTRPTGEPTSVTLGVNVDTLAIDPSCSARSLSSDWDGVSLDNQSGILSYYVPSPGGTSLGIRPTQQWVGGASAAFGGGAGAINYSDCLVEYELSLWIYCNGGATTLIWRGTKPRGTGPTGTYTRTAGYDTTATISVS